MRIMSALVIAAIGTGIWAATGSGAAISLHLVIDLMAVSYGALLYESRRRRSEQLRKVRSLARHPMSAPRASWAEIDKEPIAL